MKPLNPIYDGHRKVTDKYFTAKPIPGTKLSVITYSWEPFARAIQIEGYDDYDFFLLRKWKAYGLFEGLTGTLLMTQAKTPGPATAVRRRDVEYRTTLSCRKWHYRFLKQ